MTSKTGAIEDVPHTNASGAIISQLPDRVDTGGYVYLLGFDNGVVKIGATSNPRIRIVAHEGHALALGINVTGRWVSAAHETHWETERRLLGIAKDLGGQVRRHEYFVGVDFAQLVARAEELALGRLVAPMPQLEPAHASPEVNGARVRELRRRAGLSASELARKIGITPQYMSQIERGKRPTVSPAMFNRIVAAMGVSRDDLSGSFAQEAA